MEYTYKDKVFNVSENNLKLYRVLFPLIDKYNKLKAEALKSIDRNIILDYEKKINRLKLIIAQMTERGEDVSKQREELNSIEIDYLADPLVKETNEYINTALTNIYSQLVYDGEFIKLIITELIEGDKTIFDYEDNEFYLFIGKIIQGFFLNMKKNKAI